jgi:hypothetical protein
MSLFILEIVFFASLGVIVFLFIRKLPYVSDIPHKELSAAMKKSLLRSEWVDKIDNKFVDLLSKWLRKAKLVVMRLDNYVARHLESMKHRGSQESANQNILKEIGEGKVDDKGEKTEETKIE